MKLTKFENFHEISGLFDQCAMDYDRDRPVLVPCFDDFYGAALSAIPFAPNVPIKVLDLGAGTGLLSAMVADLFPSAVIHLTDMSKAMLDQARQRFGDTPRVTYAVQEHTRLSARSKYDLVISALSIHHLDHPDKQALFEKIYRALSPGGMFINADQALGPSAEVEDAWHRQWLADIEAVGLPEPAWSQAMERVRLDINATLDDQLAWLENAGFEDVACRYQRFRFVVYSGRRKEI
ncbi:class I SAM-dependent methyltransferase [Desulfosudis oleivorans]|uniref:Methyltransferase type 12 n=1 Tax=Desulfosudis oleivorans (strain DSM 6200 / JCM 39069 / Hxd3) TaxID=96561 RepID=A8ZX36_DESOH|nr:class I SAM-dependent methyltransferase [Desulfosudis oleivorans]ABW66892.1 Methyltransferase type 12 [Desulfosudis oleivorans Hxd3]